MADSALVRNSAILAVFAEILYGPQGRMQAVEIAGRGIAAEARCTLAVLADKGGPTAHDVEDALEHSRSLADQLVELGEIEDALVESWRRRCGGDLDDVSFEADLDAIVVRLEEWVVARGSATAE